MYISDYIKRDRVNGKGVRTTIYPSGCLHKCKGCFSYETWNFDNGELVDEKFIVRLIDNLNSHQIKGRLSILGGDAMCSPKETLYLLERLEEEVEDLNVWLWTGFTIEQIEANFFYNSETEENARWRKKLLNKINVLIDGRFNSDLYSPDIPFRGSSNQRVIDMSKIREGRVITECLM